MKSRQAHIRLERLLEVLSEEIASASDAELLEACGDLKIDPAMTGSTALLGVKRIVFPYRRGLLAEDPDPSTLEETASSNPRRPQ
jgi:hypothetical protein